MDDLDLIDPVDVLAQLSKNFRPNLESKKWLERKEALEELVKLLEKNPKLDPKAQYGEIVDQLKTIIEKDANINVAAAAVSCMKGIASGLRAKFSPYVLAVAPVLLEKFKEKKPIMRPPVTECMDAILTTTTLDILSDDIIAAMSKPNPQIKSQTDKFLSRAFKNYGSTTVPKKALKAVAPMLIKHTADPDGEVREAAYEALGSAMRATGEKPIMPLLSDIAEDKMKMDKIKEHYQKFLDEVGPEGLLGKFAASGTDKEPNGPSAEKDEQEIATPASEEADPFDLLDPVDVLAKLPKNFNELAESKKWTERRDAFQGLFDLLEKHPKLDPKAQYGEIVDTLKTIIQKDSNINVCAVAAKCLDGIAAGLRKEFAPHVLSVAPIIFEKFKEKKATLRDPLVKCLDSVYASSTLEVVQDDVVAAMEKSNPQVKTQTDLFLHRAFIKFNNATMPKKSLKTFVPLLVKHTGESDPEVRDASYLALAAAMWAVGEQLILPLLVGISGDKTKMGKIKEYYDRIVKEVGPPVIVPMTMQKDTLSDSPVSNAQQKVKISKKLPDQKIKLVKNNGKNVVQKAPVKPEILKNTIDVKKRVIVRGNPEIVKQRTTIIQENKKAPNPVRKNAPMTKLLTEKTDAPLDTTKIPRPASRPITARAEDSRPPMVRPRTAPGSSTSRIPLPPPKK